MFCLTYMCMARCFFFSTILGIGIGLRSSSCWISLLLVFQVWQTLRQQNQDRDEYCQDDINQVAAQDIVLFGNGEQGGCQCWSNRTRDGRQTLTEPVR